MTALDKFIRLEAVGMWREHAAAEFVEVIVSFGDSTLQLTSLQDAPITHWALLATKRIGTEGSAVIYAADPNAEEVLLIDDPDMTRAITAVSNSIINPPPQKRRLRWIALLTGLVVLAALLAQSPPIIYGWATKLTSPARVAEISSQIEMAIFLDHPETCKDNRAVRAINGFSSRLFANEQIRVRIISSDVRNVIALPDGDLLLSDSLIHAAESGAELAAHIAVVHMMTRRKATLYEAIAQNGTVAAMRHLIGTNIAVERPIALPVAKAEDLVSARNLLIKNAIDTQPLQNIAKEMGLGLPIDRTAPSEPFAQSEFAALRRFCAG